MKTKIQKLVADLMEQAECFLICVYERPMLKFLVEHYLLDILDIVQMIVGYL